MASAQIASEEGRFASRLIRLMLELLAEGCADAG